MLIKEECYLADVLKHSFLNCQCRGNEIKVLTISAFK